ncbi:MAG: hypothetical protein ACKVJX_23615, partial [Verrucomicrobiia bacterium]
GGGGVSTSFWCSPPTPPPPATGDVEREPGVELELHKLEDVPRLIESGELGNAFTLAVLALAQRKGWDLLKPT